MRRLLGGHACYFNRRHRRVGHLFHDRFKSLVCEEDPYLLQPVRYIHLNPLVAGMVKSMDALVHYPYVGHGTLLGKAHDVWQSADEVLGLFGRRATSARRRYLTFVRDGLPLTTTTDELGGGLVQEFAQAVGRVRRGAERELYDGRVLGEGEFVQQVLEKVEKREKVARTLERRGWELRRLAQASADEFGVSVRELFERGRRDPVSRAKSLLIFVAAEYAGQSLTTLSRATQMSTAGASKSRERGAVLYERSRLKATLSKLVS